MKPRPVEIVICLETTVPLKELRKHFRQQQRMATTFGGKYCKVVRADVFLVKRLKAGTPEGGAA